MKHKLSYCAQLVRKNDPDRFLISLFEPQDKREALWALYAFYHEIAKTREVVTDAHLGLMRLQWWQDSVAEIYAGKTFEENEILGNLARAIKAFDLPKDLFYALIAAREDDLYPLNLTSLDDLEFYAQKTSLPLMQLSHCITRKDQVEQQVIADVATGYALVGLMRATPYNLAQGRNFFPVTDRKNLSLHVAQAALLAKKRLLSAKAGKSRHLTLVARLAGLYLCQIEAVGCDVFSSKLRAPPAFKELKLLITAIKSGT